MHVSVVEHGLTSGVQRGEGTLRVCVRVVVVVVVRSVIARGVEVTEYEERLDSASRLALGPPVAPLVDPVQLLSQVVGYLAGNG